MNKLFIIVVALSLSACASTNPLPEWTGSTNVNDYGYKSYDPCIRCGEGWTFLPNPPQK